MALGTREDEYDYLFKGNDGYLYRPVLYAGLAKTSACIALYYRIQRATNAAATAYV